MSRELASMIPASDEQNNQRNVISPFWIIYAIACLAITTIYLVRVLSINPLLSLLLFWPMEYGLALALPFIGFSIYMTKGRWRIRWMVVLATIVAVFALMKTVNHVRPRTFEWSMARIAERGEEVVAAIESFETKNGHPPPALKVLVPEYISEIPETGILEYPEFEFRVYDAKSVGSKWVWYDLGSRNGKRPAGLVSNSDGDFDHAILGLVIDGEGRIEVIEPDRLARLGPAKAFDSEIWKSEIGKRTPMLEDLISTIKVGDNFSELMDRLGPPDGERILVSAKWELGIRMSRGWIDYYYLYYWPTKDYPDRNFKTDVTRVGEWALACQ